MASYQRYSGKSTINDNDALGNSELKLSMSTMTGDPPLTAVAVRWSIDPFSRE